MKKFELVLKGADKEMVSRYEDLIAFTHATDNSDSTTQRKIYWAEGHVVLAKVIRKWNSNQYNIWAAC